MSVVIPTYRRPDRLARLLPALAAQQAPFAWDVLVVDNDATGSARAVVAAAPMPVRYEVESRNGAAHARNHGLASVQAPVVALLDDDVVPHEGWLAAVCAPVLDGTAVAAGGPVLLDPSVPRPPWFDEDGLGGYLAGFTLGATARDLAADEILLTANAALDRAAVLAVGGFDPALGPRHGRQIVADDAQLVRDLRRAGGRIRYEPAARVTHELPVERLRRGYLLRRAYWQGRSDWLLDRSDHTARRFGGARVAVTHTLRWWRAELHNRQGEGWRQPAVRFHALTDLARVAGTFVEAASTAWQDPERREEAHR